MGRIPTESAESTRGERTTYGYYNNNTVLARRPKDARAPGWIIYMVTRRRFETCGLPPPVHVLKSDDHWAASSVLCFENNTETPKSNAPPRTDQIVTKKSDKKRGVDIWRSNNIILCVFRIEFSPESACRQRYSVGWSNRLNKTADDFSNDH